MPSWVSYAAQAAIAGKRVIGVPIGAEAGGVPDPAHLRAALAEAAGVGARPGVLVLTLPDNPTGTVASEALVREVCEVAEAAGLLIVCDEIYRDLAYEPERFVSPAELLPERTFVTTGLSKSMALGGWRVGLVRLADGRLGERGRRGDRRRWRARSGRRSRRRCSTRRSTCSPSRRRSSSTSRRAGACTARSAAPPTRWWSRRAPRCRPPSGAFYLYPDFAGCPFASGAELAEHLLEERGIAVLAGEAFGDDPAALRFRMATSLLYGDTDERKREALASDDPAALPWIAAALDRMRDGPRLLGLPARLDDVAVGVADLDAHVVGLVPELDDLDARGRERVAQVPHRAGLLDGEAEVQEARERRRPLGGAERERDVAGAVEHQHAVGVAPRPARALKPNQRS